MPLDYGQRQQLKRILNDKMYWNIHTGGQGAKAYYPKYTDIAKQLDCEVDDIKEYRDLHFPDSELERRGW